VLFSLRMAGFVSFAPGEAVLVLHGAGSEALVEGVQQQAREKGAVTRVEALPSFRQATAPFEKVRARAW
jgi:hypothetical protein